MLICQFFVCKIYHTCKSFDGYSEPFIALREWAKEIVDLFYIVVTRVKQFEFEVTEKLGDGDIYF